MGSIQERIVAIFDEYGDQKVGDRTDVPLEQLGLDSLDQVEIVMAVEDEFSMEIPDEDAEKLQTVGAFVKYVEENQNKD